MSLIKRKKLPIRWSTGRKRRVAQGFTMIEVLVTMVLLSIGLLGLAGLQAFTLKNNQIAYYRAIASQQAYDMGDRMRANLAGITAGYYDNLTATMPTSPPNCFTSTCTSAQMAVFDQSQWLTASAALLPGGSGTVQCAIGPGANCVTINANSNRIFDITVSWTEKTESSTSNPSGVITQSFVTRFAP